jgi:hypothetical protein
MSIASCIVAIKLFLCYRLVYMDTFDNDDDHDDDDDDDDDYLSVLRVDA